jgi:hypothetical protein
LFYRNAVGDLVAAQIAPDRSFRVVSEHSLFSARGFLAFGLHRGYVVSPDDRSFLFVHPPSGVMSQLIVVLNWFEELKAKAGK